MLFTLLVTSLFIYGRERGQISFIWCDDVCLGGTLDGQVCYCLNVCILKSYIDPHFQCDGSYNRALRKCLGQTDRSHMKEMNELLERTYCYFYVWTQRIGHLWTNKGSLSRQHIFYYLDLILTVISRAQGKEVIANKALELRYVVSAVWMN